MNQSLPERGFKLASLLGKDSCDPEEVVKFLRTVPAEDIVKAQASVLTREANNSFFLFFFNLYLDILSETINENEGKFRLCRKRYPIILRLESITTR